MLPQNLIDSKAVKVSHEQKNMKVWDSFPFSESKQTEEIASSLVSCIATPYKLFHLEIKTSWWSNFFTLS